MPSTTAREAFSHFCVHLLSLPSSTHSFRLLEKHCAGDAVPVSVLCVLVWREEGKSPKQWARPAGLNKPAWSREF